ncbi:MAG TPA: hypothetical protein VL691_21570 [Vicinamibacteria bacterium]|nr:hypothetical protein [Vicinamibacteria bacterium]
MSALTRIALAGVAALVLVGLRGPAEAGPPAQLALARYVALGYDQGDRFVSETDVMAEVFPEEQAALQTIRAGIEQWGKYVLVVRPAEADLLIAVRKGRLLSVGGGVRTGGPSSGGTPGTPIGIGQSGAVQVSSPDDMIEVFDARGGSLIWRGSKRNGLAGVGPPLFESFQAEVAKAERAAKKP